MKVAIASNGKDENAKVSKAGLFYSLVIWQGTYRIERLVGKVRTKLYLFW